MILGKPDDVWPRLRHREDPQLRSLLIDRMARLGVDPGVLVDRLKQSGIDPVETQGILMSLAEMKKLTEPGLTLISGPQADELSGVARNLYRDHPHPGVHSAAGQLLRRWDNGGLAAEVDRAQKPDIKPPTGRKWFLGPNGHTFSVAGPLEGWVGSPLGEDGRKGDESRQYFRTGRTLAVAVTEITTAQYRAFLKDEKIVEERPEDDESPAARITWYMAARYCNWLSRKAGIPEKEWCYPEPVLYGMKLDAGALDRKGFRLPTEVEWELLCRAGSTTPRPCGRSLELLPRYAFTWVNSRESASHVAELLPNEYGLFDILGNVWEWCHDGPESEEHLPDYPAGTPVSPAKDLVPDESIVDQETTSQRNKQSYRYMRGGAYDYSPTRWARSSARYYGRVQKGKDEGYKGFRVVRNLGNL